MKELDIVRECILRGLWVFMKIIERKNSLNKIKNGGDDEKELCVFIKNCKNNFFI
ncbi:hypothetical protein [Proteus terrae]|uniref:Uncharacterized protein n=1 Tax=Proteus terrae subsp. cibarius TaxID=626774 RepID=A0A8I0WSJ1_9GAMM|nr:hypothetical protein [Proteus terrae]MBG2914473.1 hypothetical protein [Proteus terrae subsp. cibarius]